MIFSFASRGRGRLDTTGSKHFICYFAGWMDLIHVTYPFFLKLRLFTPLFPHCVSKTERIITIQSIHHLVGLLRRFWFWSMAFFIFIILIRRNSHKACVMNCPLHVRVATLREFERGVLMCNVVMHSNIIQFSFIRNSIFRLSLELFNSVFNIAQNPRGLLLVFKRLFQVSYFI